MVSSNGDKAGLSLVSDVSFAAVLREPEEGKNPFRRAAVLGVDALIAVFLVALIVALAWFPVRWLSDMNLEREMTESSNARFDSWPQGKIADEYARAQAYNRKIAESGQATLGEFADPFSKGADADKPISEKDTDYLSLLNDGTGMMGTIRIPKVSVRMPIFHGTSEDVLRHGAGHLYGTSLPVGGPSTNAVLSGHSGLPGALLFTRIDELKKGDFFYIQTLNHTMGYLITGIHIIKPDDTHLYKIVPGQDLVTLMTCTPYGINTERLIITGSRRSIPDPIPDLDHTQNDGILNGIVTGLVIFFVGVTVTRIRHKKPRPIRHALVGGQPPRFWQRRRRAALHPTARHGGSDGH
ncbi:class C sortase [Bifidobacterium sp. ESL0745]|uniref:class C sortase n=1 Tax=Bifidobacterium sp. ESL0745 TaxID=2983226 RepID=UPI0023F67D3C|nr:class C sortase [Bifidobacterium sp. ESL0745]MDF7665816.1 class C sortase [Bifidobacterium sp. ESL0745]